MSTKYKFKLAQLMEMAGLSVAQATHHFLRKELRKVPCETRILIACGPGNNGGDGIVAARHL